MSKTKEDEICFVLASSKHPPPDYTTAVSMGLPSYDAAIKLDPRLFLGGQERLSLPKPSSLQEDIDPNSVPEASKLDNQNNICQKLNH